MSRARWWVVAVVFVLSIVGVAGWSWLARPPFRFLRGMTVVHAKIVEVTPGYLRDDRIFLTYASKLSRMEVEAEASREQGVALRMHGLEFDLHFPNHWVSIRSYPQYTGVTPPPGINSEV